MVSESICLWAPSASLKASSHLIAFAKKNGFAGDVDYKTLHDWSLQDIGLFWSKFWDYAGIIGDKGSVSLTDGDQMEHAHFFPEASLNWAENLLKRRDDGMAIMFRDELGRERFLTFAQLAQSVSSFQQALRDAGIGQGDRVAG
ncbi:MAG TPA: acetoacetate--CoA ligase, partial [Alphaproteobacteria bacterium]|nr:acetoacetate--CoA ligase [Alphaproteobacteria bacterium]